MKLMNEQMTEAMTEAMTKPMAKSVTKPVTKPENKPVTKPVTKSVTKLNHILQFWTKLPKMDNMWFRYRLRYRPKLSAN